MPFVKKYAKKPKTSRRRRYTRKSRQTLSTAAKRQVYKIAKRLDNKEKDMKFTFYEYSTTVSDNWTGPASFITWPVQGVQAYTSVKDLGGSESQRIGNEIEISHIQFNYRIDVADTSNVFRVVIFQWFQQSDSNFPTIGDIFMNNGAGYPYLDMYNYENKKNFKILFDKTHTLSGNAGNNATIINHKKWYGAGIPIKKIKFLGNSESGFNANIVKGALYYMFVTDSTVISHPSINMAVRMLYTDA